ncbi:MAG: transporter substrate-binding domain-containing protein [Oscillospiraceae bacterium]|nr:transporter substrate-binding domain-containing protein [Oscillospiraceae bacterium]
MKKLVHKIALLPLALLLIHLISGCARGIPNEVHSPEDVEGRRIGALAGTPAIRLASDLGSAASFDSAEVMLASLLAGEVDCIIMENTTAQELVAGTSGVTILQDPIMVYELRIAVPRENSRLLGAINAALEELDSNGILSGLYSSYFAGGRFVYQPPDTAGTRATTLNVAMPSDSPPLSFVNDEGLFVGMDAQVARAVADILGVELQVFEYEGADLITSILHGRADFSMGWHPDEAADLVHVSEPYAIVSLVVIVRR